jgi:hypothetical protein
MSIYDPLYGRFELSEISQELTVLPEVRRLSQIRLLNSISPTLATLSELRRYAHTLGVLHLFNKWKASAGRRYAKNEQDALEVAIILHDVATPPFGHLFEYILKEATGWDHEAAAVTTLLKSYSPASIAQAIYAGRRPKVLDHIERRGIDLELVKAILTKNHRLSGLIMGIVDFDNLDNVWRMAWALGLPCMPSEAGKLAESLDVDAAGNLQVSATGEDLLPVWSALRRAVYEILIFDQPTVASQAVLTHCIRCGLKKSVISADDWFLNDESLLAKLSLEPAIKTLVEQQYLGRVPTPVLTVQAHWRDLPLFKRSRSQIESELETRLLQLANVKWWVYVFKERGSFEKQVHYSVVGETPTAIGTLSQSLVVSVFTDKPLTRMRRQAANKVVLEFLQDHSVQLSDLMRIVEDGHDKPSFDPRLSF